MDVGLISTQYHPNLIEIYVIFLICLGHIHHSHPWLRSMPNLDQILDLGGF